MADVAQQAQNAKLSAAWGVGERVGAGVGISPAQRKVDQLWQRAKQVSGLEGPAPPLAQKPLSGRVSRRADAVTTNPGGIIALARYLRGDLNSPYPNDRKYAKQVLLHEFTHVGQGRAGRGLGNLHRTEGQAEQFSKLVAKRLGVVTRRGVKRGGYRFAAASGGYEGYRRHIAHTEPQRQVLRGEFKMRARPRSVADFLVGGHRVPKNALTLSDIAKGHGVIGAIPEAAAAFANTRGGDKAPPTPSLPPGAHLKYLSEVSVLGKQGASQGRVSQADAAFLDPRVAQKAKQYAQQGSGQPVPQAKQGPQNLTQLAAIAQKAHPAPKQLPANQAKRAAVLFPGFTKQLPAGAQNVAQVQQRQQASHQVKQAIRQALAVVGSNANHKTVALLKNAIKYGRKYGVSPSLLAGIAKVESGVGTSTLPGVWSGQNSAGAAGPMQIGNGTGASGNAWQTYAQQIWGANASQHSPYNPDDAMHVAAVYLKAAGAPASINNTAAANTAALAYNHAQWYADEVLTYAKQFAGLEQAGGSLGAVGGGGSQTVSLKDKNSPYVFIAPKGTPLGRTDMGVDFSYDGPVRALGSGHIVKGYGENANLFTGGNASPGSTPATGILYKLDKPVQGAQYVYVYEGGFSPLKGMSSGKRITKGQVIGSSTTAGGTSFEVGFADANGSPLAASGYTEGVPTHWGTVMADLLSGKRVTTATGGVSGVVGAAAATGAVPLGSSGAVAQALVGAPASVRNSFAQSQRKAKMEAQAAQNRSRGYITPPSGLAAQSPLPFGFGGNFQTGSQPSGSGGAFRPRARLRASR